MDVDTRQDRIQWLADLFANIPAAYEEAQLNEHLQEPEQMFGLDTMVQRFRPLRKIHEARDEVVFQIGEPFMPNADQCWVDFKLDGDVALVVYLRFEETSPHRIRYWGSYPPLPEGTTIRPYTPADAPACVELELRCAMELEGDDRWIIDRGEHFDDYLKLMKEVDAAVVVTETGRVVGFFSCALRPINFRDENRHCVYQHHYRVDPEHRGGSVALALSSFVDPRRSFESYDVQFPYSMIDPSNVHMQGVGFPAAEGVTIARLSIPLDGSSTSSAPPTAPAPVEAEPAAICQLINQTHGDRTFFTTYNPETLAERCSAAPTYGLDSFRAIDGACAGIWQVNEHNVRTTGDTVIESRLAFVLDYGFEQPEDLIALINAVRAELAAAGTTHLCFLCDTRAVEYQWLQSLGVDEQNFQVHTLPWTTEAFAAGTVYCDAIYC